MSDVSVIGLGPMGAALARALLKNGFHVTVWNRSGARAEPLVREGAMAASTAAAAAGASPVVMICVADYEAAGAILSQANVVTALAGRVLVQLSTGSPKEARDGEAWARTHGIDYLDGAILVAPSQIGGPESAMLVSGPEAAFRRSERMLRCLAANVTYLGEAAAAAAALDLAFLSHFFGGLLGFYHGARILESEGIPVSSLGAMIAEVAPALGEIMRHDSLVIEADRYGHPESSLRNSATVVELILKQALEAGINADFPLYATTLFKQGVAAGFENEDVAALIKVLRNRL